MRGIDELDHYELLEISRAATQAEIDRAYRMAQQVYGDGSLALYSVFENGDAKAIRARLDEAYRVLSDAEIRRRYDDLLPEAPPAEERAKGETAAAGDQLEAFDPQLHEQTPRASVDEAVEEFDALEDDGSGEFDGVRLRRNRLFRGYEIDDISEVTKVSGAHLRNIEDENFADLPADVYVRGFVTAYAQTIGLDPKIVVPSYMARVQESRSGGQRGRFLGRR